MTPAPPDTPNPPSAPSAPALCRLFTAFLSIGLQSFGGGMSTLALIYRTVVQQTNWITEAEFTRQNSLCQLSPGMNLLGLTILIGRRLGGPPGIVVALLGLLLPSSLITVLITVGFEKVHRLPAVQAALGGIVPAVVGLGLVSLLGITRPLLQSSGEEGRGSLALSVVLAVGSGAAVARFHLPVVLVLCGAGLVGAAASFLRARRRAAPTLADQER